MSAVGTLLSTAAESETLRRLVRITAFSQAQARRRASAYREYLDIERDLGNVSDDIARFELEVQELKKKLSGSPVTEVKERQRSRDSKLRDLAKIASVEQKLIEGITEAKSEIRRIDSELEKIKGNDRILRRLSSRLKFLRDAHSQLRYQLDHLQQSALKSISRSTNEILQAIIRKPYRVELSEDYGLTLLDENNLRVPASSGEAQLLSLSFLASLIRFCADRQRDGNVLLTPGTVAPFVLDSPFGQLDPVYRRGAASFLPKFADQVVLMLSASQGDATVLEVLRPSIGSECALVQHNATKRLDDRVEQITIDGEPVVVTHWDSPPTRTEIANVRYYPDPIQ